MKILIFGKADFDIVQLKEKLKVEPKESRFAGLEVKYRILPDFLDRNFSINFSLKLYFYTIFSINCLIYNLNSAKDEFFHLLLSKIIFLHDILNQLSHL